jgi:hypothetical protein
MIRIRLSITSVRSKAYAVSALCRLASTTIAAPGLRKAQCLASPTDRETCSKGRSDRRIVADEVAFGASSIMQQNMRFEAWGG